MYSDASGWNIVTTDRLARAAEHVQDTKITCGDYERLFTAAGDNVWVYADPPYVKDTELERSGKLYQYGFTYDDHRRLASVIRDCPHKVCLSYDNHPLVRELYRGFYIHECAWKYCGTSLKKKQTGQELLITNYPALVHFDMLSEPA
jgi:DNA adenine methylase